jgi:acyl-CoA dehydrogenase
MMQNDIEIGLSDQDRAIWESVHRFAEDVLRPAGRELDRLPDPADVVAEKSVLWKVIDAYKDLGIARLYQDTEMDPVARARLIAIVNEELAWGDVGLAITTGLCSLHTQWVQQTGDRELIERFCNPDEVTLGCWALTEPDHGSDTVMVSEPHFRDSALKPNCVARKDGDSYIINGQKAAWVSNGPIAEIAVLFCTVDRDQGFAGGGAFCVPLDLPGVERGRPLDKLGQRSLNQGELFFHDVRVPASYMAAGPEFYSLALEAMLAYANAGMAQLFVGLARSALDHAVAYAKERVQGGRPIIEHQSVKSRLFKMFMRVEASRALARRVALYNAVNMPQIQNSISAKVFCTNTAFEVASEAVQIYGGNGLSREYPVEKLLRDARASMIEDGCNEVLGLVAATKL